MQGGRKAECIQREDRKAVVVGLQVSITTLHTNL